MRNLLVCAALAAAIGCGDDGPQPQQRKTTPAPAAAAAPAGGDASKAAGGKAAALLFKRKVESQYRKELAPSDFQPDPTGDINRDPFQSFLVAPQTSAQVPVQD